MKATSQVKRTPWGEAVRVLATMFLLLACADLAFPQFCGEDNEPLFPQHAASATFGHADESREPQRQSAPTEDCFCCCSHIVSEEPQSRLGALALVSGSEGVIRPSTPVAPTQIHFRPPRLA